MKSEPHEFSVDDLAALPGQTDAWQGVRNYQARNLMRDQMRVGDKAFFYHSSCKVPGIVGLVEISKKAYPDHFQWDKKSKYFDEKSTKEAPRWWMVDVTLKEKLEEMVPLEGLREEGLKKGSPLAAMALLQKGSRLSVQPVREEEWQFICERMIKKGGKKEGGGVKKEEGKGAGDE
jgi:predicted RNA-binding protein with PUA-like domain